MSEVDTPDATDLDALEQQSGSATKLFDVRTVIGGLFLIYGVLIGGAGLFVTDADLVKAQGININLWTGLGMTLIGVLFLVWLRLRPVH